MHFHCCFSGDYDLRPGLRALFANSSFTIPNCSILLHVCSLNDSSPTLRIPTTNSLADLSWYWWGWVEEELLPWIFNSKLPNGDVLGFVAHPTTYYSYRYSISTYEIVLRWIGTLLSQLRSPSPPFPTLPLTRTSHWSWVLNANPLSVVRANEVESCLRSVR
jgi:hypothetical protein